MWYGPHFWPLWPDLIFIPSDSVPRLRATMINQPLVTVSKVTVSNCALPLCVARKTLSVLSRWALVLLISAPVFAATENAVTWELNNQKNQQVKLLMPPFSGSFESRSLVLVLSPVKYGKQKPEFSVGVMASCLRNTKLAKSYQVTTYPAAENGGRFKLALPKHLARCFKVDPKGEIGVVLDLRIAPVDELVSLRGTAFIE